MQGFKGKEDGSFEMECGCISECVNGKHIFIPCEEHEHSQLVEDYYRPTHIKKTKMRENREI